MKNYNILETLYQNYRENQDSEEFRKAVNKFSKALGDCLEDKRKINELFDLMDDIEDISNKLAFETGFKSAIQLMKECGLI